MDLRFPPRARLLPLLAALLYVLGTAAHPLLHAHAGEDAHAHAAASVCPAEDAPEAAHAAAPCALCLLSAAPPPLAAAPGAVEPSTSSCAAPQAAARPGPLAFLRPAPRGPPHA